METIEAKYAVKLSSNISRSCQYCDKWQDGSEIDDNINHYIKDHGAKLLYVGGEAFTDDYGKIGHHLVAMLGLDVEPPPKEPIEVLFNFPSNIQTPESD
ncbi:hypothetical protein D3C84_645180 [compost metagenome]